MLFRSGSFGPMHWVRGSVARGTILRRGLVEENGLGRHHLRQLVAFSATHILVRAAQRKLGPFFMVEQ